MVGHEHSQCIYGESNWESSWEPSKTVVSGLAQPTDTHAYHQCQSISFTSINWGRPMPDVRSLGIAYLRQIPRPCRRTLDTIIVACPSEVHHLCYIVAISQLNTAFTVVVSCISSLKVVNPILGPI